jgi:tetratricopeptide (TPR) repeat protein
LINEVAAFEHECQRYSAFQLIIQRTRTENREGSEEALERAREGLDLYNVVGDDQWLASLRSAGLPDSHINRVAAAVYELLLLNANLEMDSHSPPQTAMALLEQAAAFHAPSRGYYWILADCYSHLGEHQKVAQLQAKALQAPIDHAGELWYINRDRRGDDPTYPIERSLSEHREMLRFDPTYYNGLFFMSYLLANEDRYAEALVGWYGCIAQCPDDWTAVVNRGLTHEMLGHHSEALADLEAAAAAGTGARNYNWILSSLAFFLATTPADALRDGRRAIDLARQACEATDYKQSTSLDALAAAYAEIGDFQAAIQWAEKAVQLVPDDESRSEYEKHLQSFRAQRPWRKTPISTEQQSMTDREAIKNGR